MNHRLELAISDSIKDVTAINHFKSFLDGFYAYIFMNYILLKD